MSKPTRAASLLGRVGESRSIKGAGGRNVVGTAELTLGSRSLMSVPVYKGDTDAELRNRAIEHARKSDQQALPYVQNPAVKIKRRALGEARLPRIIGDSLFTGYDVREFAALVQANYGNEATKRDALRQLRDLFKESREDAEYVIEKHWDEIASALLSESAVEKVTTCDPVNEARLTQTQTKLIRRFSRDPKGTITVDFFRGANVRGASKPEGKREFDAAIKLADKGIFEIVERPKQDYGQAVVVRLAKPAYLNTELPDDLFYLLRDIAFNTQRRQDAEPERRMKLYFRGRRGPTSAEQAKIEDLAGMGLVRNALSDNPVITEKAAEELMGDKRVRGAMEAELGAFMDFLKAASKGYIMEAQEPVDEAVTTSAELKMYVGQFFNAKDVDPKVGSWYLLPAPDGKPMLFTVTGSKDEKAYGKFGILEFGRPVRNLKETFWYLDMFEFTTGDKIKPATSDIVVSADYAVKLMSDLGVKTSKVPTPSGEHTPDRFEKQTKYTVLV